MRERRLSLPSRGAWIEILWPLQWLRLPLVAPLAGSVDRNALVLSFSRVSAAVAPLAGSVDRNGLDVVSNLGEMVAPLAGSVDRNISSSAKTIVDTVAPLAGSVDRNGPLDGVLQIGGGRSPRGERG